MTANSKSRLVRVFISSTFRDFMEERDLLVRKVFPELRRKCRERQVELIDVDLRWGITEEEAQQGKVLPICLTEIDRSRPYFIGLLGDRYGWVPEKDHYDMSLIIEQPWLEEHRGGKSVTELEILYGVLSNPAMAGRAFFYLRDTKWSQKKGGAYLCEGDTERACLEDLKSRIRKSEFPVVDDYPTPGALAEQVAHDLWSLIEEEYPAFDIPDALTLERRRHEAYAATRTRLYLGGEKYFKQLDDAMTSQPFRPVLVTGASGGGKSALLANWVSRLQKSQPQIYIITHHLGAGADAADPVRMASRIMQEIARMTGDKFLADPDPDELMKKLPEWFAFASAWAQRKNRDLLLVLDGLDKLCDRRQLNWLPEYLPPRMKLVVSCLDGEICDAANRRMQWNLLRLKALSKTEKKHFISQYLGRYRKVLPRSQEQKLTNYSLSGNPLFLLTILEELRVFGVHEQLEHRLQVMLSCPHDKESGDVPAVDDVFVHVLARIEEDLGRRAVQSAMTAIWASRNGLYHDELLAITKISPVAWAAVQIAFDESIYENSGKINFGHDYLRKAVERRYNLEGKQGQRVHYRLAKWFDNLACDDGVDERIASELAWQYFMCSSKKKLKEAITDSAVFEALYDHDKHELHKYWLFLRQNPAVAYRKSWNEWTSGVGDEPDCELLGLGFRLADFLVSEAGSISAFVRDLYAQSKQRVGNLIEVTDELEQYVGETQAALDNSEGLYLLNAGQYSKAENLFRKSLECIAISVGRSHPDALDEINNLANCLLLQHQPKAAEALYKEALAARLNLFGPNHQRTISSLNGCGNVALSIGRLEDALSYYKRALNASISVFGEKSEQTYGALLNNAIAMSSLKEYQDAEPMFRRAIKGLNSVLGPRHPLAISAKAGLAKCLFAMGKPRESQDLEYDVLNKRKNILGTNHPSTLESMYNVGQLLVDNGDEREGHALLKKAFYGRVRYLGVAHPQTVHSFNHFLKQLEAILDLSGQESICSYYLKKVDISLGAESNLSLECVNRLAHLQRKNGRIRQALGLLRRRSTSSPVVRDAVCYNMACLECISGNTATAKQLIVHHLECYPEMISQALVDEELAAIRKWLCKLAVGSKSALSLATDAVGD